MRLERRRRAAVVVDSTDKWRLPVATEEADHAQVEGSSAAPFPRTEPAPDCPHAVSASARSRGLAETSGAGLGADPSRVADAQGSDPATGLAGGPREQPRRLRLQPLLRSLPAMVKETRPGVAPGASRRREDVRGLRRGHHSDS